MLNCIFVGIGGFIGSVCRYLVGLIPLEANSGFPFKTLVINVVGAFLLGLISALAAKNESLNPQIVLMLRVGICGGFTTFSTFAYESVDLMKNGNILLAFCYICVSIILSVAAVFGSQLLIK